MALGPLLVCIRVPVPMYAFTRHCKCPVTYMCACMCVCVCVCGGGSAFQSRGRRVQRLGTADIAFTWHASNLLS